MKGATSPRVLLLLMRYISWDVRVGEESITLYCASNSCVTMGYLLGTAGYSQDLEAIGIQSTMVATQ